MSKTWIKRLGTLSLVLIVLAALTFVISGNRDAAHAASSGANYLHLGKITPRFTTTNLGSSSSAAISNSGGGSRIQTWSSSFSYAGKTYPYTMVGTNPSAGPATTTITSEIIPVNVTFPTGTGSVTFSGRSRVNSTTQSPLFQPAKFTSGFTQYGDAMQRQEFWNVIPTTSSGKQYHVLLSKPTVLPTATLTVPPGKGVVAVTSTGVIIGLADYTWWTNVVQKLLNEYNIQPNTFPIILSSNVLLYIGTPSNCCVIGFHGTTTTTIGSHQTFAWASYTDPGIFSVPIDDINALSHEVEEWLNDPYTNNTVPEWNVPNEPQYGCQNILEVGDPLVGVAFVVNGYHPQDVASFSWFARLSPSLNQNGLYSYLGTFTTFSSSAGC